MIDQAAAVARLAALRNVPPKHIRIETTTTYRAWLCDAAGAPIAPLTNPAATFEGVVRSYEHELARGEARVELRRMIDAQKRELQHCHAGQRAAAAPELS